MYGYNHQLLALTEMHEIGIAHMKPACVALSAGLHVQNVLQQVIGILSWLSTSHDLWDFDIRILPVWDLSH